MSNSVTELKLSGKVIGLVDVRPPYKEICVSGNALDVLYNYGGYIGEDAYDHEFDVIDLPPGQWSIVGIASILTFADCSGLVESEGDDSGSLKRWYKDYEHEGLWFRTPDKSLYSLIAANGKKPETCLIIEKKDL